MAVLSFSPTTPTPLPVAQIGVSYSTLILVDSTPAPLLPIIFRFEPVGEGEFNSLPPGLNFHYNGGSSQSATISGVPVAPNGLYSFRVVAHEPNDEPNAITKVFQIAVREPFRITGPQTLPDARIGIEYALANCAFDATGKNLSIAPGNGEQQPVSWELSGGVPAGLYIDQQTGKLSGVITADCGIYNFTIEAIYANSTDVTGALISVQADRTLFVSALPNGLDLVQRLPIKDQQTCSLEQLNLIARGALDLITTLTEIPFNYGACTLPAFTEESVPTKSYTTRCWPRFHPVQQITEAKWIDSRLQVGSLADLIRGKAQIAIDDTRGAFRIDQPSMFDGMRGLFVSYTAGMTVLPNDLLEVFIHLGSLMWKEKDRVGLKTLSVGEATTAYEKELPPYLWTVVERYRRLLYT